MKHKIFTKTATKLLALALILCLCVGVFAYFTDQEQTDATITTSAGLKIVPEKDPDAEPDDPSSPEPDPEDPTTGEVDLNKWWAYLNAKAIANYNPGDEMTLGYILSNQGDIDVKVRETFVITSSVAMDTSDPEFDLFTAVTTGTFGGYAGTTKTGLTKDASSTSTKLIYKTDGTETLAAGAETAKDYFIVFDEAAGNAFQGATCKVDYIVEAMQADGDWAVVVTESITVGGNSYNAVPAA